MGKYLNKGDNKQVQVGVKGDESSRNRSRSKILISLFVPWIAVNARLRRPALIDRFLILIIDLFTQFHFLHPKVEKAK
ncbi:hypothetical protein ACTXT7_012353 [Hymenolepis weldensis]